MTVTGGPARPADRQPDAPAVPRTAAARTPAAPRPAADPAPRPAPDHLAEICPYLIAGDGTWQSAQPIRDQRCGALAPPVALTPAKQRSLCLVVAHRSCATYLAAQEHAATSGIARARPRDGEPTLWPVTRSTMLVVEPERRLLGVGGTRIRVGGQVGLIALMLVAFLLLVIARTTGPSSPSGAVASPSAVALATSTPRPTPSPTPAPTPTASPTATPAPTPRPTKAPNRQRYRVKAGDTLSGIALKFGTTLKVLKRINDITDPSLIRPGQVILVPRR